MTANYDELTFPARMKIQRAKHHISYLEEQIAHYMKDRPFKVVRRLSPRTDRAALIVRTARPIPSELSVVIGDAIHNLRASLDVTVFAMAHDKSPSPHKIEFPFPRNESGLEGAINGGHAKFAGERVVEVIRNLKPYPGGNDNLFGLHELDRRDKHRLLILSARAVDLPAEKINEMLPEFGVRIEGEGSLRFVGSLDTILVTRYNFIMKELPPSEKETEFQPEFSILFGEGQPFAGSVVHKTLLSLVAEVEAAVDALVCAFVAQA